MAQDPGYPDNLLRFDQVNSLFGGEIKAAFGGPAWEFLNGWVRDLAAAWLAHQRVSWSTQAPVTQEAVVVGDCLAMDFTRSAVAEAYVGKWSTIGALNGHFVGLAAETAGVGARVRMASLGPVPSAITGLTSLPVRAPVTADPIRNRLRLAQDGEPVFGLGDVSGNVLLLPFGGAI